MKTGLQTLKEVKEEGTESRIQEFIKKWYPNNAPEEKQHLSFCYSFHKKDSGDGASEENSMTNHSFASNKSEASFKFSYPSIKNPVEEMVEFVK